MPVLTGAACITSESCPVLTLPLAPSLCVRSILGGGLNDVYFIPCTEELTEGNLTDVAWWDTLLNDNKIGNLGVGIGSIGKKNTKTDKAGSDTLEQITNITWAAKFIQKRFDTSTDDITKQQADLLIQKFSNQLAIARMSNGENDVLPIGKFTLTDFDWVVPEDSKDPQTITYEISWDETAKPKVYSVPGLSAVLPKSV